MADDPQVDVKFGADTSGVKRGVEETRRAVDGLKAPVAGFGSFMQGVFQGIGQQITTTLLQAAAQLPRIIADIQLEVAGIGRTSFNLGTSNKELQQLHYAAELIGMDAKNMDNALEQFGARLGQAARGGGDLADILRANHVVISGNLMQDFLQMADLIKNTANAEQRATLIRAAFGKSAQEMGFLFRDGAAGIREATQAYGDLGLGFSEESIKRIEAADRAWNKLTLTIGTYFKQAIIDAPKYFAEMLDNIARMLDEFNGEEHVPYQPFGDPNKPLEITVTKGVGSTKLPGTAPASALDKALTTSGQNAAELRAQTEALSMGTEAGIAFVEAEKLRAIATAANINLTDRDNVAIDAQAQSLAAATVKYQQMQSVQQAMQDLAQGITSAFMSWVNGTEELGTAFLKLAAQIAEAVVEALLLDLILSAMGWAAPTQGLGAAFAPLFNFGGMRANGGPLEQGKWYMAGENGPEPVWGGGPGAFADPSALGGGETHFHYAPNVSAMDSRGVKEVLGAHSQEIARMVSDVYNKQPSSRPRY